MQREVPVGERAHLDATSLLRLCEHGVQQCATGVGIDLDELGAAVSEVEVVAVEHAAWAVFDRRDRWGRDQGCVTKRRERKDALDCLDDGEHRVDVLAAYEDRHRCEEVRLVREHRRIQTARSTPALEQHLEGCAVDRDARALAIQGLGRRRHPAFRVPQVGARLVVPRRSLRHAVRANGHVGRHRRVRRSHREARARDRRDERRRGSSTT